jgi:NTP pyrophosphatase (non-canonical NTP hydrolase)
MTSLLDSDAAVPETVLSLDDLYLMTAHIYSHRNEERSIEATFAHFVEVCGMLSLHGRPKRREGIDVPDALCKALGWLFPLCAKLGVVSVERLLFRKYPNACPYCRKCPHDERWCKIVKGTKNTVDHRALRELARVNESSRPRSLDEWREMFDAIYPRRMGDRESHRSTSGLLEELGELAEAVRVHGRHPKYVAGEIADVVSYLLGIANEYALVVASEQDGEEFSLEREYLLRYPGMCPQCGNHICVCPPLPSATIGRLAKELDIYESEELFSSHLDVPRAEEAAQKVLDRLGGYPGLLDDSSRFPFDRGEANRLLVDLCLDVARRLADDAAAKPFLSAAWRLNSAQASAGSAGRDEAVREVIASLRRSIDSSPVVRRELGETEVRLSAAGVVNVRTWRVLVIFAGPWDLAPLAYGEESKTVLEAVRRGRHRDRVTMQTVHAATVVDLQRALVDHDFDILHISSHGTTDGPVLLDDNGESHVLRLAELRELLAVNQSISCVILNSCYSLAQLQTSLGPATIGMTARLHDSAAIHFSRGFYDSLAAGRELRRCYDEGVASVRSSGEELQFSVVQLGLPELAADGSPDPPF